MKNQFKKFIDDKSAVAFVWVAILLCLFMVMFLFAVTYDVAKAGMEYSRENEAYYTSYGMTGDQTDSMRPYFELIYDYLPLWLILGLTLYGFSEAQKP